MSSKALSLTAVSSRSAVNPWIVAGIVALSPHTNSTATSPAALVVSAITSPAQPTAAAGVSGSGAGSSSSRGSSGSSAKSGKTGTTKKTGGSTGTAPAPKPNGTDSIAVTGTYKKLELKQDPNPAVVVADPNLVAKVMKPAPKLAAAYDEQYAKFKAEIHRRGYL